MASQNKSIKQSIKYLQSPVFRMDGSPSWEQPCWIQRGLGASLIFMGCRQARWDDDIIGNQTEWRKVSLYLSIYCGILMRCTPTAKNSLSGMVSVQDHLPSDQRPILCTKYADVHEEENISNWWVWLFSIKEPYHVSCITFDIWWLLKESFVFCCFTAQ